MAQSIEIIHPSLIQQTWGQISPFFNACKPHETGEISVEQMKVMLVRGEYQLMLFMASNEPIGALITSFITYPNDRVFFVHAIGGKTTKECVTAMFDYAKQQGATTVRGQARDSVARLWKRYGFNTISHTVERRL